MTRKTPRLHLHDVLEACRAIERFVAGRTLHVYLSDEVLRAAVERKCTIIGEALNQALRMDPSLAQRISQTDKIIGFRHRLIHGYGEVRDDIVWDTVIHDTPILTAEIEALLHADENR